MLRWHRLCVIFLGVLVTYLIITGTGIQFFDLRALVTHAPADDPDMQKIRQHHAGPPNFLVRQAPDFSAAPLPAGIDHAAALTRAAALGRAAEPGAPMKLVELRMAGSIPAGHVQMGDKHLIFDLATGAPLPARFLPPPPLPYDFKAPRQTMKRLHRFSWVGSWSTTLDLIGGIALTVLVVTGFIHFYRVWRMRAKIKRKSLFWKGGSWWRLLHRWVTVAAAIPLVWLVATGVVLSMNNVGQLFNRYFDGIPANDPEAGDYSSPLLDGEIAGMARTTVAAFARSEPGVAMKVLRLRYFSGYPQGVIVAADEDTSQLVFNARSGAPMSLSEPGYPDTAYPWGWESNQVLKRLHRGDSLGMPGRWLDMLGGLALCYLAISGLWLYFVDWRRRARNGRPALVWK